MTFWDHVDELRLRALRAVGAIILTGVFWFLNPEILFDRIVLAPLFPDFPMYRWLCQLGSWAGISTNFCFEGTLLKITNIRLSGQFVQHIILAVSAGLITAFPYVLWQIWGFVRPGLKENEAHWGRVFMWGGSLLFFLGILFGYFVLVPIAVQFLAHYRVSEHVHNIITLQSYVSTTSGMVLATAAVFELPIVVYTLTRMGMITANSLRTYRRHAIVIILILAAALTPPDVMSQVLLFLPFFMLYEISIGIARRAQPDMYPDEPNDLSSS